MVAFSSMGEDKEVMCLFGYLESIFSRHIYGNILSCCGSFFQWNWLFLFKSTLNVLHCAAFYTVSYFVLHNIFFAISLRCQFFCSFFHFYLWKKKERHNRSEYTMYADHTIESFTKEDAQWVKIFLRNIFISTVTPWDACFLGKEKLVQLKIHATFYT